MAHRFGPFTFDIYDEVDFLKSVGMMTDGGDDDGGDGQFCITDKGCRFAEQRLLQRIPAGQIEGIEEVKKRHCDEDLDDLFCYVYAKYPMYTVRTEILDRVLRRK